MINLMRITYVIEEKSQKMKDEREHSGWERDIQEVIVIMILIEQILTTQWQKDTMRSDLL